MNPSTDSPAAVQVPAEDMLALWRAFRDLPYGAHLTGTGAGPDRFTVPDATTALNALAGRLRDVAARAEACEDELRELKADRDATRRLLGTA